MTLQVTIQTLSRCIQHILVLYFALAIHSVCALQEKLVIHNGLKDQLLLHFIPGNTVITPQPSAISAGESSDEIIFDNVNYPVDSNINAVVRVFGEYGNGPWVSIIFAASLDNEVVVKNCYAPYKCQLTKGGSGVRHVSIDSTA